MVKEVIRVRHYKAGYEVRTELIDGQEFSCPDFEIQSAYTPDGLYIGDPKMARQLCKKFGIKPEYRTPTSSVCSIGFREKEGKWFGWSHRAIFGFKVGDVVKEGDVIAEYLPVGFKAENIEQAKEMAAAFAESVS